MNNDNRGYAATQGCVWILFFLLGAAALAVYGLVKLAS